MISKIKKIAVLGGAGLIGSYLVELLVHKGHKVVVIDDFSTFLYYCMNLLQGV